VDQLALLRSVREVAALARPSEPLSLPQRAFDDARPIGHERPALPRAKRIAERLGLPWADVLAIAHAPASEQNKLLGLKTRGAPAAWLTRDCVRSAVRVAARRLAVDTLTLGEYRAERDAMIAADRARWMHGGTLRMPTDEQVIALAGSWDAALRLADLQTPSARDNTRRRSDTAPPLVDLLTRFHDAHAYQPSARELRAFARASGVPYPSERTCGFAAAVTQWRQQRRDHGLPDPRVVRHKGGRGRKAPTPGAETGTARTSAARAGERRRHRWTSADCVAAVSRYHAQLGARERSTQRGYADWAATQPRDTAPALATVQEHGGWEAIRREAQDRREPAHTPARTGRTTTRARAGLGSGRPNNADKSP